MFELSRHIVFLLLNNDCVIVPNFGGFLTHYVCARYEEEDELYLPPLRTIGFNPQLKLNDHLLVQSYVEAYDISYPEALRKIEREVMELKQHLMNEGFFELCDLGVLHVNEDGNYEFTPCEAGIPTPDLYGFGSIEINSLQPYVENEDAPLEETVATSEEDTIEQEDQQNASSDGDAEKNNAIIIKMSWLRNTIATAVAIVLFFFISTPIDNSVAPAIQQSSILSVTMNESEPQEKEEVKEDVLPTDTVSQSDSIQNMTSLSAQSGPKPADLNSASYTICLASQTTLYHAENFIENMKQKGINDVRITSMKNTDRVRVVCGSYYTEKEAYDSLKHYRIHHEGFSEAWVLRVND